MQRYQQLANGIREVFASAGIAVVQVDSTGPHEQIASELTALLNT